MMLTFRAGKLAALMVSVAVLVSCSREQQDWRSAEASDTVEGYGQFLQRHPDSELATEARTRVAQLSEDREWQSAGNSDTADAYKQFLAQHPNGKWAQEARIRMENFALGREGAAAAPGVSAAVPEGGTSGVGGSLGRTAGVGSSAGGYGSGAAIGSTAGAASAGAGGSAGSINGPGVGTTGGATTDIAAEPAVASAWRGAGANAAQVAPGEPARPLVPGSMASGATAQVTPPLPGQASSGDLSRSQPSRQPLLATPTSAAASAPNASGTAAVAAASTQVSPSLASAWRSDPGFGVQLGAFTSENAATSEWQQLTSRFSAQLRGLAPRVVSADTSTGRLFRLQALVADEAAARTLCDMLKKQSQACVPVLPH